ncbi:hypothetical protein MKW92_006333, partial [Papaver armeniacum]
MNLQIDVAVATVFVSPIINFMIAKALTYCCDEIALARGVKGELKRLAGTLQKIEAVLHDAEKQLVERNRLVKIWLEELEDVARDAEDILSELQYELLGNQMKTGTCGFLSKNKMAHKIEDVNKKLDGITEDMKKFNFNNLPGGSGSNTLMMKNIPETFSHMNDSAAVVGRNNDKSKVLDLVNQESYSVVRITGMGGMGKTTLAQLVWKELTENDKDRFKVK